MSSFMGVGTHLYGKSDPSKTDGSYIATKWFIFLFLPLWPIRSFRVRRGKTALDASLIRMAARTSYQVVEMPFHKKQIMYTYLVGWLTPVLIIGLLFTYPILWIAVPIFVIGVVGLFFFRTLLNR